MTDNQNLSLLDVLADTVGCSCLSDLRSIKKHTQQKLADKLERICPEDYPLPVWNDALAYLTSEEPGPTPAQARQRIIDCYRKNEALPLAHSSQGGNDYENE